MHRPTRSRLHVGGRGDSMLLACAEPATRSRADPSACTRRLEARGGSSTLFPAASSSFLPRLPRKPHHPEVAAAGAPWPAEQALLPLPLQCRSGGGGRLLHGAGHGALELRQSGRWAGPLPLSAPLAPVSRRRTHSRAQLPKRPAWLKSEVQGPTGGEGLKVRPSLAPVAGSGTLARCYQ